MKKFQVTYEGKKRRFPFVTPFRGYEYIEANDIAEAKAIAEEHSKQTGWGIYIIREVDSVKV